MDRFLKILDQATDREAAQRFAVLSANRCAPDEQDRSVPYEPSIFRLTLRQ
jgi:hypothetical protein